MGKPPYPRSAPPASVGSGVPFPREAPARVGGAPALPGASTPKFPPVPTIATGGPSPPDIGGLVPGALDPTLIGKLDQLVFNWMLEDALKAQTTSYPLGELRGTLVSPTCYALRTLDPDGDWTLRFAGYSWLPYITVWSPYVRVAPLDPPEVSRHYRLIVHGDYLAYYKAVKDPHVHYDRTVVVADEMPVSFTWKKATYKLYRFDFTMESWKIAADTRPGSILDKNWPVENKWPAGLFAFQVMSHSGSGKVQDNNAPLDPQDLPTPYDPGASLVDVDSKQTLLPLSPLALQDADKGLPRAHYNPWFDDVIILNTHDAKDHSRHLPDI